MYSTIQKKQKCFLSNDYVPFHPCLVGNNRSDLTKCFIKILKRFWAKWHFERIIHGTFFNLNWLFGRQFGFICTSKRKSVPIENMYNIRIEKINYFIKKLLVRFRFDDWFLIVPLLFHCF